ncbi:MAG: hypothetical protein HQM12_13395 [SAR324 cluster bacterium]|nr:hypothetical protein [SAR324 cluster bacterium]
MAQGSTSEAFESHRLLLFESQVFSEQSGWPVARMRGAPEDDFSASGTDSRTAENSSEELSGPLLWFVVCALVTPWIVAVYSLRKFWKLWKSHKK